MERIKNIYILAFYRKPDWGGNMNFLDFYEANMLIKELGGDWRSFEFKGELCL